MLCLPTKLIGLLSRCSCGQLVVQHTSSSAGAKEEGTPLVQLEVHHAERWSPLKHTETSPTDAYGVIEFQGGGQVNKAMVLRYTLYFTFLVIVHVGLGLVTPLFLLCSISGSPSTLNLTTCSI